MPRRSVKSMLLKATLESLDFADYFCSGARDKSLLWDFVGYNELRIALRKQTLNPAYANRIASMYGLKPVSFGIDPSDISRFLDFCTNGSSLPVDEYLDSRGFPEELRSKYRVGAFSYHTATSFKYRSLSRYWLFDGKRLDYLNFMVEKYGFDFDLKKAWFVVIPSYGGDGELNNIAFRVVDEVIVSSAFKWLFSHGRQATFGLEQCVPGEVATLVEGFFDYVACKESGMSNVIGLGSAFVSPEHVTQIKAVTDRVNTLFDNDEVGDKKRAIELPDGLTLNDTLCLDCDDKDPYDVWRSSGEIPIKRNIVS